jgi:hypothetical protein
VVCSGAPGVRSRLLLESKLRALALWAADPKITEPDKKDILFDRTDAICITLCVCGSLYIFLGILWRMSYEQLPYVIQYL